MVIEFAHKIDEQICNDELFARQYLLPATIENLKILMTRLRLTLHFNVFFKKPLIDFYRTEELKGKKKGTISLRISRKDRVELKILAINQTNEDIIKILKVGGHYGD